MIALGDGLVGNDLPSKGVDINHIHTVVRAMILAFIIPNNNMFTACLIRHKRKRFPNDS